MIEWLPISTLREWLQTDFILWLIGCFILALVSALLVYVIRYLYTRKQIAFKSYEGDREIIHYKGSFFWVIPTIYITIIAISALVFVVAIDMLRS